MGMSKISVSIPVYNQLWLLDQLLICIAKNTILPEIIYVIDDASTESVSNILSKYTKLPIIYIRHKVNQNVNFCWNQGMQFCETEFLTTFNSDVIINKYFFEHILASFAKYPKAGIICARTVKRIKMVNRTLPKLGKVVRMGKREGWAWSISKELINKIYPIPKELVTYCGDDYLFHKARRMGYTPMKMIENYIYHYGGFSIKEAISNWRNTSKARNSKYLRREKRRWQKIKITL